MSRRPQLIEWQQELATRFPDLTGPVVAVLALFSLGMIGARSSSVSAVSLDLAELLQLEEDAVRKRLAEFYKEAEAKSGFKQGQKRRDFDVATCFSPLLTWILLLWQGRMLPLAIDVTNLGESFHVLCVSVVVRGVGIPVAWKILPGGVKDPWNPHWEKLLRSFKQALHDNWFVIVLSDRGLESAEVFGFIRALGWHPLMRAKNAGHFRPKGWGRHYPMGDLVPRVGTHFYAEGCAYAGAQLPCTLLGCWEEGYADPWLLLTDLPPECANAIWYGFRGWIEQGFKVIKGGMWDWQNTRMEDPARVERVWLVMAVATLWVVALGAEEEVKQDNAKHRQRLERELNETTQQGQARQQHEANRRQKQQEAQQRRQARKQARQEAREKAKAEKKAKKKVPEQVAEVTPSSSNTKPKAKSARKKTPPNKKHRVSRRGRAVLIALWDRGKNRLPQHLYPEPWPPPAHSASTLTEQDFLAQQTYP